MDLTTLSYADLRNGFEKKLFKPSEVIAAYLARQEKFHHLNLYITETPEQAMAGAHDADQRQMQGQLKPLDGLPLAIKDNFCTKNVPTTCGSKILENFIPFYESTITARLKEAGAISVGKTNMDEFAMGSSTENSAFGPTINPWKSNEDDKARSPGGSSGGSAAAVAARTALASLGSDTGGSIRQPAAFCGLVGLKPTYGRCSRFGIIAFASSLDQAGPFTRTIAESALLFSHMSGGDPRDATSANLPSFIGTEPPHSLKGIKVGLPIEYADGLGSEMQSWWNQTADWLKDAGAEVQEVSLPYTAYGLPTYYITAPAEASANLARYDGVRFGLRVQGKTLDELYENTRTQGFGEEVKRRIVVGTYVLSSGAYEAYYLHSLKVRRLIRQDFKNAFKKVDVLLTPTTPTPPFALGEKVADPKAMYLSDVFTVGSSLAGVPSMALPVGLSKTGLPIGMQLVGPDFQEDLLFHVGSAIEKRAGFVTNLFKEIV